MIDEAVRCLVDALESQIEVSAQLRDNEYNCEEVFKTADWITKVNKEVLAEYTDMVEED